MALSAGPASAAACRKEKPRLELSRRCTCLPCRFPSGVSGISPVWPPQAPACTHGVPAACANVLWSVLRVGCPLLLPTSPRILTSLTSLCSRRGFDTEATTWSQTRRCWAGTDRPRGSREFGGLATGWQVLRRGDTGTGGGQVRARGRVARRPAGGLVFLPQVRAGPPAPTPTHPAGDHPGS